MTHSDEKPYVCDICAKTFKQNIRLQNHMYIHRNSLHKQCTECGLWLRSPRAYYNHMKEKHNDSNPKSFPCNKCDHISPSKGALYSHSRNMHGPKKLKCNYCAEAFSSTSLLKSHLIKHTGPGEPFHCPHCPKIFRYKTGYYSHKRREHPNTTEKSFTKLEIDWKK